MPDHSAIRAHVAQLQATLRELELAPGRDAELRALAALEGQAGALQGAARVHRRTLSPPNGVSLQGLALRLVVSHPGQLHVGALAARMRCSPQQVRDAVAVLRRREWLLPGNESEDHRLFPSMAAIEVLGAPERRLR